MMRRQLIGLFLLPLFLYSCESDNSDSYLNETDVNIEDKDVIDSFEEDIYAQIVSGEISTIEQIVEIANTYDEFSGYEVPSDDFVSLYFGKSEYFIDLSGQSLLDVGENDEYEFDIDEYLDLYDAEIAEGRGTHVSKTLTKGSRTGDIKLLTKRNILCWNAAPDIFQTTIFLPLFIKQLQDRNIDIVPTYETYNLEKGVNSASMLQSLKSIGDYDVVYLLCHGDPRGRMLLPSDGSLDGTDCPRGIVKDGKYYAVGHSWINRNLPTDLSHTVIWTGICHVFRQGGALYEHCKKSLVADFYGADHRVYLNFTLDRFKKFYTKFIKGTPSHRAYSWDRKPEYYAYAGKDGNVYGYWRMMEDYNTVSYSESFVKKVIGKVVGVFAFPKGYLGEMFGTTSRGGTSSVEIGFRVRSADRSFLRNIPISIQTVDHRDYSVKDFSEISAVSLTLNNSELSPGKYYYHTYISYPDGSITYSDDECEVDIQQDCGYYIFKGNAQIRHKSYQYENGSLIYNNSDTSQRGCELWVYKNYTADGPQYIVMFPDNLAFYYGESALGFTLTLEVGKQFKISKVGTYGDKINGLIQSSVTDNVLEVKYSYSSDKISAYGYSDICQDCECSLVIDLNDGTGILKWFHQNEINDGYLCVYKTDIELPLELYGFFDRSEPYSIDKCDRPCCVHYPQSQP